MAQINESPPKKGGKRKAASGGEPEAAEQTALHDDNRTAYGDSDQLLPGGMAPERLAEVFGTLADLQRWVPWRMVWNPNANKGEGAWDKIPHNGRFGISTNRPENWGTLQAAATVQVEQGLSGVGLVLTNGITEGDWTLLGLDFDKVTAEFKLPIDTYAETSPSGKGVRALAWVPTAWAEEYKDTLDAQFPGCDHCEAYFGTSPRFLTITFKALNDFGIAYFEAYQLKGFKLKHRKSEAPVADYEDGEGTPINLNAGQRWTPEQQACIDGKPGIDRSNVIHGIVMVLVNAGHSQADIFATMLRHPPFWKYCLDHRHDDPDRAAYFAREEITRAFNRTAAGTQARVLAQWQQKQSGKPAVVAAGQQKDDNAEEAGQQPETAACRFDVRPVSTFSLRRKFDPRRYAVEPLLPRGVFTELAGGHGIGKSMLALYTAMHVATGRSFCGLPVEKGKAVFGSREDDAEEILRRVQAWVATFPADERPAIEADLCENLFVLGRAETDRLTLTTRQFGRCVVREEAVDLVVERCQGAVLVVLETASRLHAGDEMNEDLAVLAEALEAVASRTGAAVVLIRHVSKAAARSKETDSMAGRGGGALSDAARSVLTLVQLDPEAARKLETGLDGMVAALDAPVLMLTHAKASYSAPAEALYFVRWDGPVLRHFTPPAPSAHRDGDRLLQYIKQQADLGNPRTGRQLEKECLAEHGVASRKVRSVLASLEQAGEIEQKRMGGHVKWVPVLK